MKIKKILLLILLMLSLMVSCGCINDSNNNNIDLSDVALTSADVQMNESHPKHITEPYEFSNAAGAGKTWEVLEQYQSGFSTGIISSPQDSKGSITQILTKLASIEKAEEFISLKKTNLIEDNGYSELDTETIGDFSFFLMKDFSTNDSELINYLCYFSYDNIIITVGGSTTDSSEIIEYATLIEDRITDFLA